MMDLKYCIVILDGMADYPLKEFGGKTCVEVAKTPNLDHIASEGRLGIVQTIPKGFSPGSDVAAMSLLGYNPSVYYTGRAPLEAASLGIELEGDILAFRCNLVTVNNNILEDYSAGYISNEEAEALIAFLNERFGSGSIRFYAGKSYRHIMTYRDSTRLNVSCIPPHDIMGQSIEANLPEGDGSEKLIKLIKDSGNILSCHEVNISRIARRKNPANMIWLWGQGKKPTMPTFFERYGLKGAVISAVDLIKGLGSILGMDVIEVPGATGNIDTDYDAEARYAIDAFRYYDLVVVHIEAPDEMGHNGNAVEKIRAISNIDEKVIGPILESFKRSVPCFKQGFRIMALSDHYTPIVKRTHSDEPVPFVMFGYGIKKGRGDLFTEAFANRSQIRIDDGYKLMDYFLIKPVRPV